MPTDKCSETTGIGFFCTGCKRFFCLSCQQTHNCKKLDFILSKVAVCFKVFVCADIVCGEVDTEADIVTSIEQYFERYYDKNSQEAKEIPNNVWERINKTRFR